MLTEQLHTHHLADRTISHILKWKEAAKRPEWPDIPHLDSSAKAYWAQWDSLVPKEGVLYLRESSEHGTSSISMVECCS